MSQWVISASVCFWIAAQSLIANMSLGTSTLPDFSWPEALTFFRSSDQDQAFGAGVNQNHSFSSSLISSQTCPNSSLPSDMPFTFLLFGTHCKYAIENVALKLASPTMEAAFVC
ncbi:hypothetical protein CRV24_003805 [Beauveria bassiana]|nr:hypothetical protein CRV24_003805 [Beauveria bassiana]